METYANVWQFFFWYMWVGFCVSMTMHFLIVMVSACKWFEFWGG